MSYLRLAYDDPDSTHAMHQDCAAALQEHMLVPPPPLAYDSFTETAKPDLSVTEAAARLAAALHLHLD